MRGTHATLAASAGATAELIAQQLSHDPQMTKLHYMADGGLDLTAEQIAEELPPLHDDDDDDD